MPESVAVQIMSDAVVLAKAQEVGDGASVTALVRRPIASGDNPREAALGLIREHGIQNLGLAVLVNWQSYSLRDMWLPFATPAQIQSTIKFELEDDLDEEAQDLLVPFDVIGQRPDASHVLAWPATKETIGGMLDFWESAGVSPEYMPPDAMGHVGLLRSLATDLVDEPVVVVSGDASSVDLSLICDGGRIFAHRRIQAFAWATDAAGRPLQEVRRTFLSAAGFPTPKAVISFGGEPADTLARVTADDLGCACRTVDPPDFDEGGRAFYWPAAAGVAMFMATTSDRPLSFRLEEYEAKETAQVVSLLSWVAMFLLAVCFGVGGAWFMLESSRADARTAHYYSEMDKYWQVTGLPRQKKPETLTGLFDELRKQREAINKELLTSEGKADALARLAALADLITAVPKGINIELSRWDIDSQGVGLVGKSASYDDANAFRSQINASKGFKVDRDNIRPQGTEWAFDFRLSYK